jgi:outer membrane receptor for ferrienterochelin and colicin
MKLRPFLTAFAGLCVALVSAHGVALAEIRQPSLFADASTAPGAKIVGRVIDTNGGLPIPGALVELSCTPVAVKQQKAGADGSFTFDGVAPGVCTLLISARGYQDASSSDLVVGSGGRIELNIALTQTSAGSNARTIGRVLVTSSSALQTSSTINTHIDPSTIQSLGYARAGDTLVSLPGVTTFTGSSVGDDLSVSIRGFDSSETATLLDGHPIGPIGAFSGGFDYQVSPFFGLRNIQTVFGSGATGIWGASTIAGTVNFETINPTQRPQALIQQGVGSFGKGLTGIALTGSSSKLGYAFSSAVQGTYGLFKPQQITQSGLLGTDLRSATIATDTYIVTQNYLQRDNFGKLTYAFSPQTNLTLAVYAATSWDDKSGNGDNDNLSFLENLYNTYQGLAANGGTSSVTLPNGSTATCNNNTQAALTDTPAGFSCFNPQQYAQLTSGPAGGGVGPWQAIRNMDYHAKLSQGIGKSTINVDSYLDWYGLDYNRSVANNSWHTDFYRTTGILVDDEMTFSQHNFAFGYYYQLQQHTGDSFPFVDQFGNTTNIQAPNPEFFLNQSSYFVRDEWAPSSSFSVFGNLWLQHSTTTHSNSFNPRLAFIYRPTSSDVVRLAGGHSNSIPDPSLLYGLPSFNTTPNNINPNCGGGGTQIGSVSDPSLVPETATDTELAYGHRFNPQSTVQLNVYNANEFGALFGGNLPLSALGQTQVPPSLIATYLARIASFCKSSPTTADLSVSTTYNAAQARYRGLELSGTFPVAKYLIGSAAYDVQSAVFNGIPDAILMANPTDINGAQRLGVPLHKANLGFDFATPSGFDVGLEGTYIGYPNNYNRQPFSFANATLSQKLSNFNLTLAVNNVFDSASQSYGYFGLGLYQPENQFGTDQNAFQQSVEQFGIIPRSYFFTVTYHT